MAIPEYKNGYFEEMAAWTQIQKIVGDSTLIIIWQPWQPLGCLYIEMGKF